MLNHRKSHKVQNHWLYHKIKPLPQLAEMILALAEAVKSTKNVVRTTTNYIVLINDSLPN